MHPPSNTLKGGVGVSDFLLRKICLYLKEGKISVEFNTTQCIERYIYTMNVYSSDGEFLKGFDIRKGDMNVIKLVAKVEGFENAIRC